MKPKLKVHVTVGKPLGVVWDVWTNPEHITKWNAASEDWHTPTASNDLRTGGGFTFRMEAKDGSMGFDMGGVYTKVIDQEQISYIMADGRSVNVWFKEENGQVEVTEIFEAEDQNPIEMQQAGWQSIMDNFKKYTESLK
ncbi:MAG: SRPBCC family protein [Crocinitomicaceae bacterium]|jgi:uncharacterized protein YndB with AHSA1/START domain|nr:SRPBCC family protein [Crocinitomicaceae bacterium]